MGVPSFYKWLVNKYPKIVTRAIEQQGDDIDTSNPNPNAQEYDNLYLDMNGIIHPCFHAEDMVVPPTTFEDVFKNIFEYIDRLFNIVRPRKLLFMAIDGVAPRAKMNQQRTRRFRNAKDNADAELEEERLRAEFKREGKQVLPKPDIVLDSNIITPGTIFMHELAKALKKYIRTRIESDPGWKEIKVILSDANVPGEGEHKIMKFIRQQRTSNNKDYNPNTRHCLYGLDADLILLALASHELHFSILREDVLSVPDQKSVSESGLSTSLTLAEPVKSRGWWKNVNASIIKKSYQFMHVWILREYLELDMEIIDIPEKLEINIERIIDDFIFLCFFTGNDFLPHMPTLQIHEGAIDLLMTVYKQQFKSLGGYLVDMERVNDKKMGFIKLNRVEKFILSVGTYEDRIFKKRSDIQDHRSKRVLRDLANQEVDAVSNIQEPDTISEKYPLNGTDDSYTIPHSEIVENTKLLKEKLKECLHAKSDLSKNGGLHKDLVKLGIPGWKNRYYKEKFSAEKSEDVENVQKSIVEKYAEGLVWVLLYYFSDVPSWTWFYPFHYGPFASDLKGLSRVKIKFEKGSPFKPFDQLMGVLPPRSSHALPKPYEKLMTDVQSNIIDFYPTDFKVDTDGKRFLWQGVIKLAFIDESLLLTETRNLEKELGEEALRNVISDNQLFLRSSSQLGSHILETNKKQSSETIDTSDGLRILPFSEDSDVVKSISTDLDVQTDRVLCVFYELPNCDAHIPRVLAGVEYPDKTIFEADINQTPLWHDYYGSRPPVTSYASRKKVVANTSEHHDIRPAMNSWLGRGKALATSSESGGRNYNVSEGISHLRISDSRESCRPYGHARPINSNNFWPSRNNASFNRNDDRRQQYSNATPLNQGRGRGGFQSNSSTQSQWRSQSGPRDAGSMWRPRGSFDNTSTQSQWRGGRAHSDRDTMWKYSDTSDRESNSRW